MTRVSDPYWFNADPDPPFFLIAYAHPNPVSNPEFYDQKSEKNYSWKKINIFLI